MATTERRLDFTQARRIYKSYEPLAEKITDPTASAEEIVEANDVLTSQEIHMGLSERNIVVVGIKRYLPELYKNRGWNIVRDVVKIDQGLDEFNGDIVSSTFERIFELKQPLKLDTTEERSN